MSRTHSLLKIAAVRVAACRRRRGCDCAADVRLLARREERCALLMQVAVLLAHGGRKYPVNTAALVADAVAAALASRGRGGAAQIGAVPAALRRHVSTLRRRGAWRRWWQGRWWRGFACPGDRAVVCVDVVVSDGVPFAVDERTSPLPTAGRRLNSLRRGCACPPASDALSISNPDFPSLTASSAFYLLPIKSVLKS